MNGVLRERELLSAKLKELKAELSTVTVQRDELEKCNLETRLQVHTVCLCLHESFQTVWFISYDLLYVSVIFSCRYTVLGAAMAQLLELAHSKPGFNSCSCPYDHMSHW